MLKAATPNPFTRPGCKVVLEPIDHAKLVVGRKTVAEYEGDKSETVAASFEQDLDDASAKLAEAIKEGNADLFELGLPGNTFTLRPKMTKWEPGFDVQSSNIDLHGLGRDAEMAIVVDIVDVTGNVVEENGVEGSEAVLRESRVLDMNPVDTSGASRRMRTLATRLGKNIARYISERMSCAKVE